MGRGADVADVADEATRELGSRRLTLVRGGSEAERGPAEKCRVDVGVEFVEKV